MKNGIAKLPRKGSRGKKSAKARMDFEEAQHVASKKIEKGVTNKVTSPEKTKDADNSANETVDNEESDDNENSKQINLIDQYISAMEDDDSDQEGELNIIIHVIHVVILFLGHYHMVPDTLRSYHLITIWYQ